MVIQRIKNIISRIVNGKYSFNKSNPLGGDGERVDIQPSVLQKRNYFNSLDIYQKSHIRRYEFAVNQIDSNVICGDFACGTGYGSYFLSKKASNVIGADLNADVIEKIKLRYKTHTNIEFIAKDILTLNFENYFDTIVSFETIEHFSAENILKLLHIFNKNLKLDGKLIFSTPYMQEQSKEAVELGFHLTFYINEEKINDWLNQSGFEINFFHYQNYDTHNIEKELMKKEFIIGVAKKVKNI